jgi:hypothetical protein
MKSEVLLKRKESQQPHRKLQKGQKDMNSKYVNHVRTT